VSRRWFVIAGLLGAMAAHPAGAQPPDTGSPLRLVVLGHVRGDRPPQTLNPKIDELVAEVRSLAPRFVVLTGDIIWGDIRDEPEERPDPAEVEREWDELDAALAKLGVPIYRVPGNHDISDLGTRDIWRRRYGALPQSVVIGGVRLLLLTSVWIPPDGDTRKNVGAGVDLDATQLAWLDQELARPFDGVTLAFMHHLLWWQPDSGRWWTEVHPRLAKAGVAAVFSGDYGPLKFSHTTRDRVRYYQSSIEFPVSLQILRERVPSRILSAQFDNFLEVLVSGGTAEVRTHTFAESSNEFTPERYRAIRAPAPFDWRSTLGRVVTPGRVAVLIVGFATIFGAGWWLGRRSARRGA
jgi:3',5'-cyclic AMP phosphodiesterase CpdA